MLPDGTQCNTIAWAYIDHWKSWYRGSTWSSRVDAYMHEMGHNYALHHAIRNGVEYGDRSCRMASSDNRNKGFNAPHTWSLGFVGSQKLDAALPVLGQSTSITLTAPHDYTAGAGKTHIIKIDAHDGSENLYMHFVQKEGYNSGVESTYANKVNIYTWAGGAFDFSYNIGQLTVDQSMTFANFVSNEADLRITVNSVSTSGTAQITLQAVGAGVTIPPTPAPTHPPTNGCVQVQGDSYFNGFYYRTAGDWDQVLDSCTTGNMLSPGAVFLMMSMR